MKRRGRGREEWESDLVHTPGKTCFCLRSVEKAEKENKSTTGAERTNNEAENGEKVVVHSSSNINNTYISGNNNDKQKRT